ncbi:MAG TPA: hypothetical protein VN937_27095 [Blastocatellia bacterium]|nr:hypothetical protein [Blastocatellia bacterium]
MTMKRDLHSRRLFVLSIFFAALPFAFGLVRAVRTGYDLRYFWVALASLIGAIATISIGRAHIRTPIAVVTLVAGVFVIATLVAVLAATLIGTIFGMGIIAVASAFAFCFAVGGLLHLLARRPTF